MPQPSLGSTGRLPPPPPLVSACEVTADVPVSSLSSTCDDVTSFVELVLRLVELSRGCVDVTAVVDVAAVLGFEVCEFELEAVVDGAALVEPLDDDLPVEVDEPVVVCGLTLLPVDADESGDTKGSRLSFSPQAGRPPASPIASQLKVGIRTSPKKRIRP